MKNIVIVTAIVATVGILACRNAPTRTIDAPLIVSKAGASEISPVEARLGVEAAYSQFVDVRTPEEYAAGHAYRARNIPLETLMSNLDKLEKHEPVYLICQSGNRSRKAAEMLVQAGFSQAISISGGMTAWEAAGLLVTR